MKSDSELVGTQLAHLLGIKVANGMALYEASEGSLRTLLQFPLERITQTASLGPTKIHAVSALHALCERYASEVPPPPHHIRGPKDVYELCKGMAELPAVEFHVLLLNAQHQVLRDVMSTRDPLSYSVVYAREVFREAITHHAAAIILVHNKTSGDPTPSTDDKAVTAQLVEAGVVLDIPVHDHVIIGRNRYLSFAEAGLL